MCYPVKLFYRDILLVVSRDSYSKVLLQLKHLTFNRQQTTVTHMTINFQNFWHTCITRNLQHEDITNRPCLVFVTTLACKILIATLVTFTAVFICPFAIA